MVLSQIIQRIVLRVNKLFCDICLFQTQHLFPCLANILGRLIPRCSDPAVVIRQTAIDCVHIIFKIAIKHEGKRLLSIFSSLRF